MALFDPTQMLLALVKQMGIGPADVDRVVRTVARADAAFAEITAFKSGFQALAARLDERLDTIERKI